MTLTPEDLATDELRKARQSINVEDRESRRTDWLEEHKGKIQVRKDFPLLEYAYFNSQKTFNLIHKWFLLHLINVQFMFQVGMGLDPNNVWEYEPEVESDAE